MSAEGKAKPPTRTLSEEARTAMLDMAATTLAAIHTAKQVSAEIPQPTLGSAFSCSLPTLPLGLGDILFGATQLQVDFTRRLIEFNRSSTKLLRDRLLGSLPKPPSSELRITAKPKQRPSGTFILKNRSRLARRFEFSASEACKFSKHGENRPLEALTIPGEESENVNVEFENEDGGNRSGDIVVRSQGIKVESIPYWITIGPAADGGGG